MMKKKQKKNIGLPPGTVMYTGQSTELDIRINYVEFSADKYKEELDQGEERVLLHPSNLNLVQWYDIRGLHDENLIKKIGGIFSMHPLAIEDAVDVSQRPLYTEYDTGAFLSMKNALFDESTYKIQTQNVSFYFGEGFVISFQENEDDLFKGIRNRLANSASRIRHKK